MRKRLKRIGPTRREKERNGPRRRRRLGCVNAEEINKRSIAAVNHPATHAATPFELTHHTFLACSLCFFFILLIRFVLKVNTITLLLYYHLLLVILLYSVIVCVAAKPIPVAKTSQPGRTRTADYGLFYENIHLHLHSVVKLIFFCVDSCVCVCVYTVW